MFCVFQVEELEGAKAVANERAEKAEQKVSHIFHSS
jgi:hypothetical protein